MRWLLKRNIRSCSFSVEHKVTGCHLETMPPCHVQVKTPSFFRPPRHKTRKILSVSVTLLATATQIGYFFLSVLEGLGSMRVKLLILSVFLAKLGDFGWESESLSGDADLVEQDLIPGQSAASVLRSVTVCYRVLQCVTECYSQSAASVTQILIHRITFTQKMENSKSGSIVVFKLERTTILSNFCKTLMLSIWPKQH